MEGIDYTGPIRAATVAAVKAAGVKFVARYLAPQGKAFDWKRLTAVEATVLRAAKVPIVLVWETDAKRVLGGNAAGKLDGAAALKLATSLGFDPRKVRIHFAVDYDAPQVDQPLINAYADGFALSVPVERLGAYGGYWPLKRLHEAGKVSFLWQTMAWSGGLLHPAATIYQYHNGGTVAGFSVDHDRSLKADFGQNPGPSVIARVIPKVLPKPKRPAPPKLYKVDITTAAGTHVVKAVRFPSLYLATYNISRQKPARVTITPLPAPAPSVPTPAPTPVPAPTPRPSVPGAHGPQV